MKSKLPHSDEYCIRYLMKELDPSEEHMVEEMMAEDEDILIEVESLRQTYKKLGSLPKYDAPSEVLGVVMERAGEYSAKPSSGTIRYMTFKRVSYAAAAAVIVGAGINWMAPVDSEIKTPVANIADQLLPSQQLPAENSPWVDNRDILHINTAGFLGAGLIDSTTGKLRLVDSDQPVSRQHRQVQLTGTQR
jgi:hypothetical protein